MTKLKSNLLDSPHVITRTSVAVVCRDWSPGIVITCLLNPNFIKFKSQTKYVVKYPDANDVFLGSEMGL